MITCESILEATEFKGFCAYLETLGFEFGYDQHIQDFVLPRIKIELTAVASDLHHFLLVSLDNVFFEQVAKKIERWGVSEVFVVLLLLARYKKTSCRELIEWGFKPVIAEKFSSSYP